MTTIALVTDSASMLPPPWQRRDGVLVAPMTIVLDGVAMVEGHDVSTVDFYRRVADGAQVSTAAPSPGELLACYETARDSGASAIVSIHTGSAYSAVLDAARVASRAIDVPVELVDTGTVSFPVALCIAAAVDTRTAGGDTVAVAEAARDTAGQVDSIFVVGVPDLAEQGGRLSRPATELTATTLLTLGPDGLGDQGNATDIDDAVEQMARYVQEQAQRHPLRVGVGDADRPALGAQLANALAGATGIVELTRYEVGPSVGAHTGPGTIGAVWAPR